MELNRRDIDDIVLIDISGDISFEDELKLADYFDDLMEKGEKRIILNLAQMTYINSSALGQLLRFSSEFSKKNGKFCLCNLSSLVAKIFRLTRVSDMIKTFSIESDALKYMQAE